jgi:hypothetical protein
MLAPFMPEEASGAKPQPPNRNADHPGANPGVAVFQQLPLARQRARREQFSKGIDVRKEPNSCSTLRMMLWTEAGPLCPLTALSAILSPELWTESDSVRLDVNCGISIA